MAAPFSTDEDFRKVSLTNLGNGAAVELFDHELQKVLANIDDPNTDPKEKRKIIALSSQPDTASIC